MSFQKQLSRGEFVVLAEMDTPKGVDISDLITNARRVKSRVDAVIIPDMGDGMMRMSALGGAVVMQQQGIEAICGRAAWEYGEGFVLEDEAGIAGYGHLMPGRIGHWLTTLIHPRAYDSAEKLLDYGLALLNYYPPNPVYCAVREYQGGLRAPLQDRGFRAVAVRCRTVKHTTVRVKEPARALVPALEKRAEASRPTASRSEGN